MYSIRPGQRAIDRFIPASSRYGVLRDPQGTEFPHVFPGEDLGRFNFFEAASIRKIGNKYLWVYSGYSGPDYGLGSTNSALRYAYGDSALGPWKSGGVLVDSRAVVLSQDGSRLETAYSGHNTHGSIEQMNGQYYVFYHRAPRGFGNARQAMVAPVRIEADTRPVSEGGRITIRAYDPYAPDSVWTARDNQGNEYTGAEVTSEGFNIYGLNPYQYYSAGYASYLSNLRSVQDSWDVWDNNMSLANVQSGDISVTNTASEALRDTRALGSLEGTRPGNNTVFELHLAPRTAGAFKINVWLDGPWDNNAWKGKKIGEISVPANSPQEIAKFTLDVASAVENLEGKHAIFLVAEGAGTEVFATSSGWDSAPTGKTVRPVPPTVSIKVNGE
jgi:hypothetical protein